MHSLKRKHHELIYTVFFPSFYRGYLGCFEQLHTRYCWLPSPFKDDRALLRIGLILQNFLFLSFDVVGDWYVPVSGTFFFDETIFFLFLFREIDNGIYHPIDGQHAAVAFTLSSFRRLS